VRGDYYTPIVMADAGQPSTSYVIRAAKTWMAGQASPWRSTASRANCLSGQALTS